MKFNDLSIQEKAAVIKLGVGGGLRSLLEIRLFWDGIPDDPPIILNDYYPEFDEYKKGGSIHIKPENRGKLNATKKRTGKTTEELTHSKNPLTRKRAIFALNARKWHHKHSDGGPINPLNIFDRWRQYMLDNTIDVPITFRLPEITISENANYPKRGNANFEGYIANSYNAWKRGDLDINTLPTELRNYVRGYSGKLAALRGMNTAAKIAGITAAIPLGIIGGISASPYIVSTAETLGNSTIGQQIYHGINAMAPGTVEWLQLPTWLKVGTTAADIGFTGYNAGLAIQNPNVENITNTILGASPYLLPSISKITNIKPKFDDLVFKYGINRIANGTNMPTNLLRNYRSNVNTRKVISLVLKDNPNLPIESKEQLIEAALNMRYLKGDSWSTQFTVNDNYIDPSGNYKWEMYIPKFDRWSNTHEVGHIVDDATPGFFSLKQGNIPGYKYSQDDLNGNKYEQFADIFANIYSRNRKPIDYLTHESGKPWSLKNRVDLTSQYKFTDNFGTIRNKNTGEYVFPDLIRREPNLIDVNFDDEGRFIPIFENNNLDELIKKEPAEYDLSQITGTDKFPNDFRVLIKPLAEGADIEKQLSRTGTISRNSLDAYIKKQGKFYQDVMTDVLKSDFSGTDKINYNDFKNAVSKKLPEYKRIPLQLYKDYGFQSLGYKYNKNINEFLESISKYGDPDLFEDQIYTIQKYGTLDDATNLELLRADVNSKRITRLQYVEGINDLYKSMKNRYLDIDKFDLSTFTFESPGIKGDTKHYPGDPIGHSRTYTTTDEPDVLHVMESQSDWAQSNPKNILKYKVDGGIRSIGTNSGAPTNVAYNHESKQWEFVERGRGAMSDFVAEQKKSNKQLAELLKTKELDAQGLYLADNYTSRQIQENLKFAALRGLKKMRYPTRETAAKIELYPETRLFDRSEYTKFLNDYREKERELRIKHDLPEYGSLTEKEFYENMDPDDHLYQNYDQNMIDELRRIEQSENYKLYLKELSKLKSPDQWMEELPMGYDSKYETILKKYSDFPKQYRKLFKDADVRTITDSKGNTWYEVDVPENYRKGKAEILMNLAPYIGLGLGSFALNKKKAFGGPIKPFSYLPIPEVRY